LSPGKPVIAASLGKGGDIRQVDFMQHPVWDKQRIKSYILMRDLVAELSTSIKFDKVEVIRVEPNQEGTILAKKCEAL
jgi:hypothetical protein